jgi:hypothetical protein
MMADSSRDGLGFPLHEGLEEVSVSLLCHTETVTL